MIEAFAAMPGIERPKDCCAGDNGLFWYPSSVDPVKLQRSYARNGHFDNINRDNYELITGRRVNKILFDGTTAVGVQFVSRSGGDPVQVKATKEVILAAGAVHTPQVLQLSGIGPKALLEKAGIPVLVELPGVGQKFQDQAYIPSVSFRCKSQSLPGYLDRRCQSIVSSSNKKQGAKDGARLSLRSTSAAPRV
jgi:choline dehydrogenase-like flavoprotein